MRPDPSVERAALLLLEDVLDVPETMRESFLAARTADTAVISRVRAMLEADRQVSLQTGAAVLGLASTPLPERIGPYRVTALIGQGGMGAVYRAERDAGDFERTVAIKVVKPGLLSEKLRDRLATERQTLAGLVHPNIARLYDGGETADGAPFIVMELVDGQPIDRFANEAALDEPARLQLLEAVADAIAHAHRRLVIHRDITPLNVLVTCEGVPKVIDFGIARGTDEATTVVDIAGLGRLLKRLVPEPGSELSAIAARATDPDEAHRYPTADAFAADLARYRTGHAVDAMEGGRLYHIGKFVSRHRLGVVASVAALLMLTGAFVAVLVANAEARRAEALAQARFEQTRGIANALLTDVFGAVSRVPGATLAREKLAQVAVTYLDALAAVPDAPPEVIAEAGRGYVRLADVVGGTQHASLGRYKDAEGLLQRAESLLEPAWRANPRDLETALAFADLRLVQTGNNLYADSRFALAREQAREVVVATDPWKREEPQAARMHAVALQAIGDSHGWASEIPESRDAFLEARAFIDSLEEPIRSHVDVRNAESAILRLLSESHHLLKEAAPARAALDRAVAINRALVAELPGNAQNLRKLAISLWYSAVVHRTNGQDAEARAAIDEAMQVVRAMVASDPADRGALNMVAVAGEVASQIAADRGDTGESARLAGEVLAAHDTLVAQSGEASGAIRTRASAMRTIAGTREQLGDRRGACAMWQRAVEQFQLLERRDALSEYDRNNALVEGMAFLARNCP